MEGIRRSPARYLPVALFYLAAVTIGAFISTRYLLSAAAALIYTNSSQQSVVTSIKPVHSSLETRKVLQNPPRKIDIPLNCSLNTTFLTCPAGYYPSENPFQQELPSSLPSSSCPDYFRWIYDDLWPWRETGIARNMVESARRTANFRLVILDGKAYVVTYTKSFQSRDTSTLWGILQLLRRYPGKVPDLDLMFDCVDWPVIKKADFEHWDAPPALFGTVVIRTRWTLCFQIGHSGGGMPEINIKPWELLSKEIEEGNKMKKWSEREPYAYWKGNPVVAPTRMDLLKCNVSDTQDWNARVYAQDWLKEQKEGYKQSDLANQCIHRYKIYIEGSAWSVSEKYILACDSVTLLVKPRYYDFFTRSLMPLQHYWPIKDDDKCRSIKYAVEWGNDHPQEVQSIGKAASRFVLDDVKMDYVYDYMFHLLSEYAKLLKYNPTVPEGAVELCSESMACMEQGVEKKFMTDSLVKGPSVSNPCTMPPPYSPASFQSLVGGKNRGIEQVETRENEYWHSHNKQM